MIRQYELLEKVKSYDPTADEDILNRAYVYAMKAHGSQKRDSGDPYFSHPLEVAGILSDLKLDDASIAAGLLHDTLEDTEATYDELKKLFGEEVANLVEGVTKLSQLELQSEQSQQAENFRKLLLASSKDIRVLLIKLADRLHNMRTLHFLKNEEKRKRKAAETMEIYTPLAERIGVDDMKTELQDLAFKELHADARASILARLEFLRTEEGSLIERIITELRDTLKEHGITAEVSGREKTPYSIWFKMQKKNVSFEQLADIMAFRIFVEDVPKCYQALGVLHSKYSVVPGRFKDYISTPKPNGYRSIHTIILGPEKQKIEIQIRTHEMHEIAEHGVAAHWSYKQGKDGDSARKEGQQYRWLRELLDILEQAEGPQEFLEHTKLEMFEDRVFCFTPAGQVIELPKGATPVDFAYAVHSLVGDRCVGARVNGRIVPLKTALQNGDSVEILTSKTQTPSPAWEQFVVTGKAKARIRRFIRTQKREQYVDLGRSMLQRAFRKEGYVYNDKAIENILTSISIESLEELFAQVGEGRKQVREILFAVYPSLRHTEQKDEDYTVNKLTTERKKDDAIPIRGMIPGMAFRLAKCCHPLPGDRIVGIMTTGRGVTIHTIDCDTLQNFKDSPERWLDVSWSGEDMKADQSHVARVAVVMQNEAGGFGTLGTVIAKNEGLIHNLRITNRTPDFFELLVDVEVKDIKHLNNIIAALRATTTITSVERMKHS